MIKLGDPNQILVLAKYLSDNWYMSLGIQTKLLKFTREPNAVIINFLWLRINIVWRIYGD